MDADTLQNYAVPAQSLQFASYGDGATERTPQEVAAAAAGYAPAESTDPDLSAYDNMSNHPSQVEQQPQQPTGSPTQTRRQGNVGRNLPAPQAARGSPQQTRQTRASLGASNNTPARTANDSIAVLASAMQAQVTPMSQQMDTFQVQQPDVSNPHMQGELVFKNTTSNYPPPPTDSPSLSTRSQSKAYTTPHGAVSNANAWTPQPSSAIQPNTPNSNDNDPDADPAVAANPFSDHFPLIPNPPDLEAWRQKLFNVTDTLVLSEEEYLTYFPHVDNVYSHRSTQKYKRKPFVSHYWDCRLKGRPSGTPKSNDPNKKKRKRQARERDLCDVKIKVTEYFSAEQARQMGLSAPGSDPNIFNGTDTAGLGASDMSMGEGSELTIVLEDGVHGNGSSSNPGDPNFGLLQLPQRLPKGHPGANGKRWFTIQRVRGNPGGGAVKDRRDSGANGLEPEEEEDSTIVDPNLDLDHKHSLEESDRIKKNSVQRWLMKEEKEKKRMSKLPITPVPTTVTSTSRESTSPSFRASGMALFTARSHAGPVPNKVTFFSNSFCPFAHRIWIALEIKGIPYQMVEVLPADVDPYRPPELLEVNPEAHTPCIRHGNFCIWESNVVLEYLEDLAMGHSLLPLGNPQLKAHCRLWTDHINRKILPSFYSLLLTPPPHRSATDGDIDMNLMGGQQGTSTAAQHSMLITTLQTNITELVNASHVTGPFFLGDEIGFVDVAFAPWIIRLSRVLSYYRNFPRPEVGTRWRQWVDAIEADERVRRTVSDEHSYHGVYRGVGEDGWDSLFVKDGYHRPIAEINYAKRVVGQEGFGLGGDVWGRLREAGAMHDRQHAMDA